MVLSTTWKLVAQTVRKSMTGFSCRCAEKERLSRRRHRLSICIKCFISSCHGDMATLHDRISQTFSSEHKTLICGFGVSSIKRVSSSVWSFVCMKHWVGFFYRITQLYRWRVVRRRLGNLQNVGGGERYFVFVQQLSCELLQEPQLLVENI